MPRADLLPNDVEGLKKLLSAAHDQVQRLSAQLHSRDVLIEKMKLQLAQLKRMKFGRSSEQLDAQIAQLELSLEELGSERRRGADRCCIDHLRRYDHQANAPSVAHRSAAGVSSP
jgi:chromosome segregation ATPase